MTGPKPPRDPLGPPDPADPFYVPPDFPRFDPADAPQAPADPIAPTPAPGTRPQYPCPHCGALWQLGTGLSDGQGRRAAEGDAGVCQHCNGLVIATATGWRMPTYDEAAAWDYDPRTIAARTVFKPPE
jgi:hypothetical protein